LYFATIALYPKPTRISSSSYDILPVVVTAVRLLSRRSRQRDRLHASICLSVCLSPNCKNVIFSKN